MYYEDDIARVRLLEDALSRGKTRDGRTQVRIGSNVCVYEEMARTAIISLKIDHTQKEAKKKSKRKRGKEGEKQPGKNPLQIGFLFTR